MSQCEVCGTGLPDGAYASCQVEGRCLTHCSNFIGHCSDLEQQEREEQEEQARRDSWLAEMEAQEWKRLAGEE